MIEPDSHLFKKVRVNAGQELRLHNIIRGRPAPVFDWQFNGKDIVSEGDRMIENNETESTIVIKETSRSHSGQYRLVAQNACGIRSHDLKIHVMERPDKPTGPITIT